MPQVRVLAAFASFSFLAGCGSDEGAASGDQASDDSAAPAAAAPADTSMAGMQHAAAGVPGHAPAGGDAQQPRDADSILAKQGADYDMAFRMHTIAHHREAVRMVDQFLPRLTRPELRTMAERMKADQAAEIQKLEREMGHG